MSPDDRDRLPETPEPAEPPPETTASAGSDADGAAAPAGASGAGIDIIVDDEGRVIFTDLPPELQAIVDELDPDSPRSQVCLVPDAAAADAAPNAEPDAEPD